MLPLTFSDVADYDKVLPSDRVSLVGLDKLGPGQVSDGTSVLCSVQYSSTAASPVCIEAC